MLKENPMQLNETHRVELRSWVESANAPESDFPIQNLPYGVFRRKGEAPRVGIAIGDRILDLTAALKAGLFRDEAEAAAKLASGPTLNALMAAEPALHRALRRRLSQILDADNPERSQIAAAAASLLAPMADAQLQLPVSIGSFTDFLTSIYHTERGGRMTRPENPVPPPFRYLPIAYNGRATSVRASGEMVRRPNGQWRNPDGKVEFGPTRQLDFELELGFFVGRGNELGEPISIDEAPERIFGFCLLNDWSARDVQRWESALGPFLSKSLSTTISCWVVTAEALAPFRAPAFARPDGDPVPLPYLSSETDQKEGGIDLTLEAYLVTPQMRRERASPALICRTNFLHMYWTVAQMVTHHMSNGCNLRTGDLLGSGTTSGPLDENRACYAEITTRGSIPWLLPNGERRVWVEDGDEIIFRGRAERKGHRSIGFGECRAVIAPAPLLHQTKWTTEAPSSSVGTSPVVVAARPKVGRQ
jgi:fumarylacetoacetase